MTVSKSHNRKVRKAKRREEAGKPLRRWELDRLRRDKEGRDEDNEGG
jgi:hypothetical protein